jgi:hypothetical protein
MTFKRDAAAEAIFPALAELGAALEEFQAIDKPKRHPDLEWHELDELPNGCLPAGWSLSVGYSVEWDDGRADVWIHEGELNTGQRVIPLARNELPAHELEAVMSEMVEEEARAAAHDLSHPGRNDDGDYAFDRSLDK